MVEADAAYLSGLDSEITSLNLIAVVKNAECSQSGKLDTLEEFQFVLEDRVKGLAKRIDWVTNTADDDCTSVFWSADCS